MAACYDAYLALGVENYLVGVKPPLVRWILQLGGAQADKEKGIRELQLTAERGNFLKPFAQLLLAVAALRDHDYERARFLLMNLHRDFPDNPLFLRELTKLEKNN